MFTTATKILLRIIILTSIISCGALKKSTHQYPGNVTITDVTMLKLEERVVFDPVQIKYSVLLKVSPSSVQNLKLYYFIEKWFNTPYKWGGTNEKGIDCSAFLQRLLYEVYSIKIPRTSLEQFYTNQIEAFSSKVQLSEGDLVFFKTVSNTRVSHVGLYLQNNMFINCSSSKGVSIASLDNPYWKNNYVAAGRVKMSSRSIYSR